MIVKGNKPILKEETQALSEQGEVVGAPQLVLDGNPFMIEMRKPSRFPEEALLNVRRFMTRKLGLPPLRYNQAEFPLR